MWKRGCDQPDEDTLCDMYLKGIELLNSKGYRQYEISNFAKGGKISRHNSKYWDLSEYLGPGMRRPQLLWRQEVFFCA